MLRHLPGCERMPFRCDVCHKITRTEKKCQVFFCPSDGVAGDGIAFVIQINARSRLHAVTFPI